MPGSTQQIEIPIPAFDVVAGNPPYVRSQQLDDVEAAYKRRLHEIATLAGVKQTSKFDAFAFFIIHAAKFLKAGGRLAFVTSAAWLTARYGAPLQHFLLREFRIREILWSEADAFFPAQDINTIVLIAERLSQVDKKESRGRIRFVTLTIEACIR
jgi:hypothetical protein